MQDNDSKATAGIDPVAWTEGFIEMFALVAGDFATAVAWWRASLLQRAGLVGASTLAG